MAIDIKTIVADAMSASLILNFRAATFSKALETNNIAIPRPTTERKSIFPTSLNANPMASTATAISNIVPTPFFIFPSCFLSPPAFSKSLFLSPADFI